MYDLPHRDQAVLIEAEHLRREAASARVEAEAAAIWRDPVDLGRLVASDRVDEGLRDRLHRAWFPQDWTDAGPEDGPSRTRDAGAWTAACLLHDVPASCEDDLRRAVEAEARRREEG